MALVFGVLEGGEVGDVAHANAAGVRGGGGRRPVESGQSVDMRVSSSLGEPPVLPE
jgi:hypothetical protein